MYQQLYIKIPTSQCSLYMSTKESRSWSVIPSVRNNKHKDHYWISRHAGFHNPSMAKNMGHCNSEVGIFVSRGSAPFCHHLESQPLARPNFLGMYRLLFCILSPSDLPDLTGSLWIKDFPWPEVAILGADQKVHGLSRQECELCQTRLDFQEIETLAFHSQFQVSRSPPDLWPKLNSRLHSHKTNHGNFTSDLLMWQNHLR